MAHGKLRTIATNTFIDKYGNKTLKKENVEDFIKEFKKCIGYEVQSKVGASSDWTNRDGTYSETRSASLFFDNLERNKKWDKINKSIYIDGSIKSKVIEARNTIRKVEEMFEQQLGKCADELKGQ